MKFIINVCVICLLFSCSNSKPSAEIGVEKPLPITNFLSEKQNKNLSYIGGPACGDGGEPGKFYLLTKKLVKKYPLEDLKVLTTSKNPYVRCLGITCLAHDLKKYRSLIETHSEDLNIVTCCPIGCEFYDYTVRQFVDKITNDPLFSGYYIRYNE